MPDREHHPTRTSRAVKQEGSEGVRGLVMNMTYYGFHKPGDVQDKMGNRLLTSSSLDPRKDTFGGKGAGKDVFPDGMRPTEGPEVIQVIGQDKWYVYADPFRSPLEAWETSDFVTFKRITVTTPAGAKHGSMIPITERELESLLAAYPGASE